MTDLRPHPASLLVTLVAFTCVPPASLLPRASTVTQSPCPVSGASNQGHSGSGGWRAGCGAGRARTLSLHHSGATLGAQFARKAGIPRALHLQLRGGAGDGGYRTRWSTEQKSAEVEILDDGCLAWMGQVADAPIWIGIPQPHPDTIVDPAWSVRAADPLPSTGEHYFEVVISQPDIPPGDYLEEGWNAVGLVAGNISEWDGAWWDDERRFASWSDFPISQLCLDLFGLRKHRKLGLFSILKLMSFYRKPNMST